MTVDPSQFMQSFSLFLGLLLLEAKVEKVQSFPLLLLGLVVHPPHGFSLSRDLRVSAPVFKDGGRQSGRGSHPDIQKHGAEDRDRIASDTIVRHGG